MAIPTNLVIAAVSYNGTNIELKTGSSGYSADEIATRGITGSISLSDSVTSIGERAFENCTGITGLTADKVVTIGANAFASCHFNSTKLYLPECTSLGASFLYNTTNAAIITNLILPKVTAIKSDAFRGCKITNIDLGPDCASIEVRGIGYNGTGQTNQVVVLRRTSDVVSLASANGMAAVGASTIIYVPSSLIASYQSASNWSTKYASNPNLFQALEGSPYENAYVDGTIIAA